MEHLMRHIMVATDGSKGANRAIDVAAGLASALAGDLLIATVADSQLEEEARQFARVEGNIGDVLEALSAKTLRDAEARARHLGASRIELRTGSGDVAQSLIDIAAGNSVEMIVLGRRGRGQLAGLLLGSVSQKLVSLAPCAVTVVP
jgi:nucleotide-binding universal stress UspA family protein